MKEYIVIPNNKAYQLLNSGALTLISSVSINGKYNIAPIAWQCPVDFDPVTRILIAVDKEHKTYKNIEETKQFAISIPHISQLQLVKITGACTGNDADKFEKLNLETKTTEIVKCMIPVDCIAYIECKVHKIIANEGTGLIIGEAVLAKADKNAYNGRLLSEKNEAKTLHHLGGKVFISTSDNVL